jgi:hypothetical protein
MMQLQVTQKLLRAADATQQAVTDWSNNDPKFWPAFHLLDERGDLLLTQHEQEWAREVTPTGERFHVFVPSHGAPAA